MTTCPSRVFGDDIQGQDCGEEAADWLTMFLGGGKAFRLVHFKQHMKTRKAAGQEKLFPQREVRLLTTSHFRTCPLVTSHLGVFHPDQARPKPVGGPKQNLIKTFWGHHRGVTRELNSRFLTGGWWSRLLTGGGGC